MPVIDLDAPPVDPPDRRSPAAARRALGVLVLALVLVGVSAEPLMPVHRSPAPVDQPRVPATYLICEPTATPGAPSGTFVVDVSTGQVIAFRCGGG